MAEVNLGLFDSLCYDSDLDDEVEVSIKSKGEVKVRVDQYLTTCGLGLLALRAGDVQLAKDRFNFAMDLELLSEMESTTDFGVTGELLRNELVSRNKSKTVVQLWTPVIRDSNVLWPSCRLCL